MRDSIAAKSTFAIVVMGNNAQKTSLALYKELIFMIIASWGDIIFIAQTSLMKRTTSFIFIMKTMFHLEQVN